MRLLEVVVLAALVAGCMTPSSEMNDAATPSGATEAIPPTVLTWHGAIPVGRGPTGAALLDPTTVPEAMPVLAPIWRTAFILNVTASPRDLSLRAEWSARGPTEGVFFMAVSPPVDGVRAFYHSGLTSNESICLHLPPAAMPEGDWLVMLHAQQTIDLVNTVTVALDGGAAAIHEMTSEAARDPSRIEREQLASACSGPV